LDVLAHCTAQVTFNLVVPLNQLPDPIHFGLREVIDSFVLIDLRLFQDLIAPGATNAMDISQSDLNPFVTGQVHTCNPGHLVPPFVSLVPSVPGTQPPVPPEIGRKAALLEALGARFAPH
jgi:hypothetical protein